MFSTKEVWIRTYTGKRFNPLAPCASAVCLEDIAHALSLKCRFGGHCKEFYSVAEHSIRVLDAALERFPAMSPKMKFHLLFHDAAEAYLPDYAAPVKPYCGAVVDRGGFPAGVTASELEEKVFAAILWHFQVDPLDVIAAPIVKEFDRILLSTEARDLMGVDAPKEWAGGWPPPLRETIQPRSALTTENRFHDRAEAILREMNPVTH